MEDGLTFGAFLNCNNAAENAPHDPQQQGSPNDQNHPRPRGADRHRMPAGSMQPVTASGGVITFNNTARTIGAVEI